jgi:AhpD family alkylhydroperoxidase
MKSRTENPAVALPGVLAALQQLSAAAEQAGLPRTVVMLVELRASQINGCAVCLDMHSRELWAAGETDERIATVAAWRETPYFTGAERAALALTEAVTRLADRPDPVGDEVWAEAARHYDERALGALVLAIGQINLWNRLNVATRQITGEWVSQWVRGAQEVASAV